MATHYETLGVSPRAEDVVIDAAYKALMKRYHPDARNGDPSTETQAKAINEAYRVLRNPEDRARYDRELKGAQSFGHSSSSASERRRPSPSSPPATEPPVVRGKGTNGLVSLGFVALAALVIVGAAGSLATGSASSSTDVSASSSSDNPDALSAKAAPSVAPKPVTAAVEDPAVSDAEAAGPQPALTEAPSSSLAPQPTPPAAQQLASQSPSAPEQAALVTSLTPSRVSPPVRPAANADADRQACRLLETYAIGAYRYARSGQSRDAMIHNLSSVGLPPLDPRIQAVIPALASDALAASGVQEEQFAVQHYSSCMASLEGDRTASQ